MKHIHEIFETLGIDSRHLIPYGKYKAKIHIDATRDLSAEPAKLILVTGMTPTAGGEGKTTTSIGLTQGLAHIGKKAIANLREPSLGPIFGIKGGGTGGGLSKLEPEDEINIHFTGDAHAVSSAHNLLAAIVDSAVYHNTMKGFTASGLTWRRVSDMQDRSLRSIVTGIGAATNGPLRETGFDIIAASEIMAILALSKDLEDLRARLSRIVVGFLTTGAPVTAFDLDAVGPMMTLLRHTVHPNLVQTTEGQPAFVHAGPFGNIAHGCSSIIADNLALGYTDYVITEAGFGADLGFEKFMHIKTRASGVMPAAVVLVTTVRAVKSHGGVKPADFTKPNAEALIKGYANPEHLIKVIKSFGLPVVVAINRHPSDTKEEVTQLRDLLRSSAAEAIVESTVFADGGKGGIELAEAVTKITDASVDRVDYLYPIDASIEDKVSSLATQVYGASGVVWSKVARKKMGMFTDLGWSNLPICMAKTHLSISDKADRKAAPSGYDFRISDLRASIGAGFIYPIAGSILTMPGLPASPRELDIDSLGNLVGSF
jgi:formate--tetrahydrofolate ligase